MDSCAPPRVTGDVDIARFLSRPESEDCWRVSITGTVHFLTDADTARRIFSLAHGETYESAYHCYAELAGACVCAHDTFVAWSEEHRDRLERLADTSDGHPLRFRYSLLTEAACHHLARHLGWLFNGLPAVLLLLLSAALVGGYRIMYSGHWQGTFWLAMPLALLGIFVHEVGHITACVRYGARHGGIGIGLYWIWPAFYADVRGSWSLPARQRLQVSAGGLYFQCIYAAVLAGLGLATDEPTFGMAIQITLLLMATTCNPVFKYDGYWILGDLFNATNIHTRIAEHLQLLLHGDAIVRKALLRTRWTWLSVIAAAASMGYITYIGVELLRSASTAARHLATNWRDLVALTHRASSLYLWLCNVGLVAQLMLIGVAFLVLGTRSLRAMATILQGRGADNHDLAHKEHDMVRPTAG